MESMVNVKWAALLQDHHNLTMHRGLKVKLYAFLTSALDSDAVSRFNPEKLASDTHWVKGEGTVVPVVS
jgi:hypothetical protein